VFVEDTYIETGQQHKFNPRNQETAHNMKNLAAKKCVKAITLGFHLSIFNIILLWIPKVSATSNFAQLLLKNKVSASAIKSLFLWQE
jgi:hypothetical protein